MVKSIEVKRNATINQGPGRPNLNQSLNSKKKTEGMQKQW